MSRAKGGDSVQVHCTGRLKDGPVFETSTRGEPLRFRIGNNELLARDSADSHRNGSGGVEDGQDTIHRSIWPTAR
jgi:hypothetical protein